MLLGAILGDMAGSVYEHIPARTMDAPLFPSGAHYTDDTVTTVAVALALLESRGGASLEAVLVDRLRRLCRACPNAGYGKRFRQWLSDPDPRPYGSLGNGSAMRAAPCGWYARSLEEAVALGRRSASVTHDHPDGLAGGEVVAGCVYLARTGSSKADILEFIRRNYYPMEETLDDLRRNGYALDVTCRGSVPQALQAFLEGSSVEEAVRGAISLGGDSDTQACIAGGVAEAFYGLPPALEREVRRRLPDAFLYTIDRFTAACLL